MKLNCTTPFHMDRSRICTNDSLGWAAINLHTDIMYNNSCLYPCQFLSNFVVTRSGTKSDQTVFRFKPFVEKYEARYTYGVIDLFAALGGYIGLFLGFSLFQIRDGIVAIIKMISQ